MTKEIVETTFKRFLKDPTIAVILLTQEVSEEFVKELVQSHEGISPVILEIPSKEMPYEAKKDIVMQRAHRLLYGADIS
jgi:V-type H+-transporting ATPase subunit F